MKGRIFMREMFLIVFIVLINIVGFKDIPKIKDDVITAQVIQNEDISKSEITDNKISQDTTKNREIYIWNAYILGGYDTKSNKWISPYPLNVVKDYERITFEDVLSKEVYYLYNNDNEYVKDLSTIFFPYSPGYLLSEFEGTEELIKLNKLEIDDEYMFDLPISNKDILDINYPGDSFAIGFNRDDSSDLATRNWLASSTNKIEFFADQYGNNLQNIPEKTKEVVYNMFLEKGYDKVIPFYKYCFQGDFDNDGYDEYLTVVNNDTTVSNRNESEVVVSTTGKAAYFYIIIFQDNDDDIQIMEDYLKTPDEDTLNSSSENEKRYFDLYCDEHLLIRNVAVVDLNNDGKFEILLEEITNRPRYKVYSFGKNNYYTLVMETLLIMTI
jgi:hypothetical protein